MPPFKLEAEFTPKGDQAQAIDKLAHGIQAGLKHQVLLGVTGSGKTFTMANLIERVQKPTLVLVHNKTLAGQLTIHADRGSPMKSHGVAMLLGSLGITKTHSRPHVSNDNPYSEAQFKTLKYCPEFPDRFGSYEDALGFCHRFFGYYNHEHRHSGIGLMTPSAVPTGSRRRSWRRDRTRSSTPTRDIRSASCGSRRDRRGCPRRRGSTRP